VGQNIYKADMGQWQVNATVPLVYVSLISISAV